MSKDHARGLGDPEACDGEFTKCSKITIKKRSFCIRDGLFPPTRSDEELLVQLKAISKLKSPNILEIKRYSMSTECVSIIYDCHSEGEYLGTFRDLVDGPLSPCWCGAFCSITHVSQWNERFCQVCAGLRFIHNRTIFHRDLTPDTIHVYQSMEKEVVKLSTPNMENILYKRADLDQARKVDLRLAALGDRDYRSPELLSKGKGDKHADMWSLGCIIYEISEGAKAFPNNKGTMKASYKQMRPNALLEYKRLIPSLLSEMPALRSPPEVVIRTLKLSIPIIHCEQKQGHDGSPITTFKAGVRKACPVKNNEPGSHPRKPTLPSPRQRRGIPQRKNLTLEDRKKLGPRPSARTQQGLTHDDVGPMTVTHDAGQESIGVALSKHDGFLGSDGFKGPEPEGPDAPNKAVFRRFSEPVIQAQPSKRGHEDLKEFVRQQRRMKQNSKFPDTCVVVSCMPSASIKSDAQDADSVDVEKTVMLTSTPQMRPKTREDKGEDPDPLADGSPEMRPDSDKPLTPEACAKGSAHDGNVVVSTSTSAPSKACESDTPMMGADEESGGASRGLGMEPGDDDLPQAKCEPVDHERQRENEENAADNAADDDADNPADDDADNAVDDDADNADINDAQDRLSDSGATNSSSSDYETTWAWGEKKTLRTMGHPNHRKENPQNASFLPKHASFRERSFTSSTSTSTHAPPPYTPGASMSSTSSIPRLRYGGRKKGHASVLEIGYKLGRDPEFGERFVPQQHEERVERQTSTFVPQSARNALRHSVLRDNCGSHLPFVQATDRSVNEAPSQSSYCSNFFFSSSYASGSQTARPSSHAERDRSGDKASNRGRFLPTEEAYRGTVPSGHKVEIIDRSGDSTQAWAAQSTRAPFLRDVRSPPPPSPSYEPISRGHSTNTPVTMNARRTRGRGEHATTTDCTMLFETSSMRPSHNFPKKTSSFSKRSSEAVRRDDEMCCVVEALEAGGVLVEGQRPWVLEEQQPPKYCSLTHTPAYAHGLKSSENNTNRSASSVSSEGAHSSDRGQTGRVHQRGGQQEPAVQEREKRHGCGKIPPSSDEPEYFCENGGRMTSQSVSREIQHEETGVLVECQRKQKVD